MKFERRALDLGALTAIIERAGEAHLSAEERDKLKAALNTLAFLTGEIGTKGMTIERRRRMVFGASTEKTDKIFPDLPKDHGSAGSPPGGEASAGASGKQRRPGHGRNGADSFTGAVKLCVLHGMLHHGDRCPECLKGKLYTQPPAVLVRIRGLAPLQGMRYELERRRCSLCGEVFTAAAPAGVGERKYDQSATAMIALLKYAGGLPFNRIEKLQKNLGIPMPAATQWELVSAAADPLRAALHEMIRQAAQGEVVHNDDTTMKRLAFGKSPFPEDEQSEERTGVYTPGIVSRHQDHDIALYFTGRKHAGENLARVLEERAATLPPPLQMCDALSHNTAGEFDTIVANCIAHARRSWRSPRAFPSHAATCWRPCARSTVTTPRPVPNRCRPTIALPITRHTALR